MVLECICKDCRKVVENRIKTDDITGNKGIVAHDELDKRVKESYENNKNCECGGVRHRLYTTIPALWFNNPQQGKISQRYL